MLQFSSHRDVDITLLMSCRKMYLQLRMATAAIQVIIPVVRW